jgi:alanine racemase
LIWCLGIGVYGVSNDPAEQKYLENGKSVIPKRTITAGESVGYGRKFMAEKPTKVATIPMVMQTEFLEVGENGFVTIKIKKAKILGSVCMDMLMMLLKLIVRTSVIVF